MITSWPNSSAFKRHVAEMDTFRRAHAALAVKENINTAVSAPLTTLFDYRQSLIDRITPNDNTIIVPIWEITLPAGTQN